MFLLTAVGVVIEQVSGQSFFEYVRTHIFERARMEHTDFYELDEDVPNRAMGYMHQGLAGSFEVRPRRNNVPFSVIKGSPHGGGEYPQLMILHGLQRHCSSMCCLIPL